MQFDAEVASQVDQFCTKHKLSVKYHEANQFLQIGNSGFSLSDISNISELPAMLWECLADHLKNESIRWQDGLLTAALRRINDDPTRGMIEDRLAEALDKPTLDAIAKIFAKYARL